MLWRRVIDMRGGLRWRPHYCIPDKCRYDEEPGLLTCGSSRNALADERIDGRTVRETLAFSSRRIRTRLAMMPQSCFRVTSPTHLKLIARQNIIERGILVKAVRTHGRGGPEQIFFEDAPLPDVQPGDVLVRV